MEDTDKLLKTAINLHYHDRPKVVVEAMQVIQDYLNMEQTDSEYDKVLKTLHDLMNDLPSNILIYFLTTVPLPKEKGKSSSTFSELMKKSREPLIENMQSVLTEYLNNAMPPLVAIDTEKSPNENVSTECINKVGNETNSDNPLKRNNEEDVTVLELVPAKKANKEIEVNDNTAGTTCKNLLEICAEYVVLNFTELQRFYSTKNEKVWNLVNKNSCTTEELSHCYVLIKDLNKKLKLLRMIEAGHVSTDVFAEQYGESEIFLKVRNLYNIIDEDAFTICEELQEAIQRFLSD